ncbi:MAG TPA: hypothetical protein VGF94_04010 [Kofleriaceae bacterium]|jgi:hypothetical protein
MRTLAIALLLATGCVQDDSTPSYPTDPGGPYDPGQGSGGGIDYGCQHDSDCGAGYVCARTYECLAPDEVRTVHIAWTLEGQPATATSCSSSPDLEVDFDFGGGAWWGWAPVPCVEGVFTIDKMPTIDNEVSVSLAEDQGTQTQGLIDATTGKVTIDLPF